MERLQKFLAYAGIASRRKAEQLILAGKVKVNGQVVTQLGTKVQPIIDIVEVNGKLVNEKEKFIYILLNKPRGYISTVKDEHNRLTVLNLLKGVKERVYPVGRLDYDTEGLLLLTNDGELAYKLTHPKNKVEKVYEVLLKGNIKEVTLKKLAVGVELDDGITAPAKVKVLKKWPGETLIEINIWEGRNRQVRRMIKAVGYEVKHLKRVKISFLELKNLKIGDYRDLTPGEVDKLKDL